ncbi:MAG: MBL fold metallo-hydrolase [Bacteroidales bacterium]|nr:MBL fold metallo-hydrolase [Bacteroidales bacterium]
MSRLYLSSLNSGSNGNCYYVGNDHDAVLIDAGISCRETEQRLKRQGLSLTKVRAILISHEHSDHTRGVEVLSRKHRIPVCITPATHRNSLLRIEPHLLQPFSADEELHFGSLTVRAFQKHHDAADPHSFTVTGSGITVGIFTDIGSVCEQLIHHFSRCHAAFLEANYDETMLEEGRYPYFLKRRIRGGNGHLSNLQALELFNSYRAPFLELLVLSHLSRQNNHPQIVTDLFAPHANGTRVTIASRFGESEVFAV